MNNYTNKNEDSSTEHLAGESASEAIDAVIKVVIGEKALSASVFIAPPKGAGSPPTMERLLSALKNFGVSYNIDMRALIRIAANPEYCTEIIAATGVAPVNGKNGEVEVLFNSGDRAIKPKENKDGTVDYRNLNLIENVSKGQVLCKISFPTEGTPGMSVKGEVITNKMGRFAPNCVGKNTELSADGKQLISKIDGQVDMIGNKVCVNDTYRVNGDVSMATGNISVAGNLVITGMVFPGFEIKAAGSIDIFNTVESAKIEAGGNVRLRSGITGSELNCEGALMSRFIENCTISVKGEIQAEYVMNSNVRCGQDLVTVGSKARIIGGSCISGGNIRTGAIGSAASAKTKLEINSWSVVFGRQQELLANKPKLEKQLESLKPLMTMLEQLRATNRLTPEKQAIYEDVNRRFTATSNELEEIRVKLEEATQTLQYMDGGRVFCLGTIHPGTEIVIGHAKLSVKEAMRSTSLSCYKGVICQLPLR